MGDKEKMFHFDFYLIWIFDLLMLLAAPPVSLFQGWAYKRSAQEADFLIGLYDQVFEDAHVFIKQSLKPKMDLLECNYIMQVCSNSYLRWTLINQNYSVLL